MATIIFGSYMVRYPLGGMLSWALQYLVGLKELGHEVYFVEKYAYQNSCYNPVSREQSNDCTYGLRVVNALLDRVGLVNNWCFVESGETYHGISKNKINDLFKRADLYIECGAHGSWEEESHSAALRVYIDQDPGYNQIKLHRGLGQNMAVPVYDHYFTIGRNVGQAGNIIPTVGIQWKLLYNPVNSNLFTKTAPPRNARYSTVMNWRSYDDVELNGVVYGQKDVEFEKFKHLPGLANVPLEVAVSGIAKSKAAELRRMGWKIKDAQQVTASFDSFCNYLTACKGEFSVCKNGYVATRSGWFSDKSAAYMASGRPVVVQDTGFSQHLPVGAGLFAFNGAEEAAHAFEAIEGNYAWHSEKAQEVAREYLETKKVLKSFLNELGI